jgi:hypothetical protein
MAREPLFKMVLCLLYLFFSRFARDVKEKHGFLSAGRLPFFRQYDRIKQKKNRVKG